jgi:uncharacterized protein YjbI with pentapeptide repeats
VQELNWIHQQLEARQKDRYHRQGWDETEALKNWAILCGTSPIDKYLFDFICDEIRLQNPADVEYWQKTLCHLIGFMLRHGMPMELLPEIKTFHQANQQARNAEEALLVVLNACARVTQKISQIEWPAPDAFGNWISRLHGQRVDFGTDILCLNCLSFLDLQDCILTTKDFYLANLEGTNLQEANLAWADLGDVNLQAANLAGANLAWANLAWANLAGANLEEVNLEEANLERANLEGANLEGANLAWANLAGANLEGAILPADFEDEDLIDFEDDFDDDSTPNSNE